MFSKPLLAAAAVLSLTATHPARAETVAKTLDGTSLSVEVNCVDKVDIQPDAGLSAKVTVEASSPDPDDLKDFIFTGGETASVTRKRQVCISMHINRPGVTVAIKVPAGIAIDIQNGGSTDYIIGAVGGSLHAHLAGSGNVSAETVTDLALSISGSSDARLGQVTGPGEIGISGSGDVRIGNATMPSLKIDVRGSGNVTVDKGQIGTLGAAVAGSGDLKIRAEVRDASLATVGSGDIDVAKVTGALSSSKAGSGTIRAGKS